MYFHRLLFLSLFLTLVLVLACDGSAGQKLGSFSDANSANEFDASSVADAMENTADGAIQIDASAPVVVQDFSIQDVNESSQRFEQAISPRDYLGKISAWYFGHAT